MADSPWRVGRKDAARALAQTAAAVCAVVAAIIGWILVVEFYIIRQDGYLRDGQRGDVFLLGCAVAVLLAPAVFLGTKARPRVRLGVAGTVALPLAAFFIWVMTVPGVG